MKRQVRLSARGLGPVGTELQLVPTTRRVIARRTGDGGGRRFGFRRTAERERERGSDEGEGKLRRHGTLLPRELEGRGLSRNNSQARQPGRATSRFMSAKDSIGSGKVVTINYTLTGEDGKTLDESGPEGMDYLHAAENIVPGLEKQLEGRVVGDKLRAVVPALEGYGERKGGSQKVARSSFPDDVEIEAGMQFMAEGPEGDPMPVWSCRSHSEPDRDRFQPSSGGRDADLRCRSAGDSVSD